MGRTRNANGSVSAKNGSSSRQKARTKKVEQTAQAKKALKAMNGEGKGAIEMKKVHDMKKGTDENAKMAVNIEHWWVCERDLWFVERE